MKLRLVDVLHCRCGTQNFDLKDIVMRQVHFHDQFTEVRCQRFCALKGCLVKPGSVTPQDCMECYGKEVMEGSLRCKCGQEYLIRGGIPRFLPKEMTKDVEKIQKTFSLEWKMFRFGERNWGQDLSYRRQQFLQAMGVVADQLQGKLIFDAGCGSGLLSMDMARTLGMEVVALDLAFGIEQAFLHNESPYVHFVQGSVMDPPIRDGVFDYVYCAGVLVACPDTRKGFLAIIQTLKRGARCVIWVYHPIDSAYHPKDHRKLLVYNWIRQNITSRLPIKLQNLLYLSLMPLFLIKQGIGIARGTVKTPLTWREKMQGLVDMFSPIYQNRHRPEEVEEWYKAERFSDICVVDRGPYGFGVRGDLSSLHSHAPQ